MHLAALPPIYVSGTSRTNFGNNRTGSDRMSTGCPPGILDTVLLLQPEALPARPTPVRVCFYRSFSLYSSPVPGVAPFRLFRPCALPSPPFSPFFPFLFSFYSPFHIGRNRENANCPEHRPIFIFYWAASATPVTFDQPHA